jgi:hypothetical protein
MSLTSNLISVSLLHFKVILYDAKVFELQNTKRTLTYTVEGHVINSSAEHINSISPY